MGNALETILRREIGYPEYNYIFDVTDLVLRNSLLLYPSKKTCMKESKRLFKKAQKLLKAQFSAKSPQGIWRQQADYYANIYRDVFEPVLPAVKKYCQAIGKECEYINFTAKLSSARSQLEASFRNELVKNANFYARQAIPVGNYFKDITYKTQLVYSDRSIISKIVQRFFKKEVLWTPEGLVFALEELQRSYDYRLRRYFRLTAYYHYEYTQELINSFVQSFQDYNFPYTANQTIAGYFEILTDTFKQKKSA